MMKLLAIYFTAANSLRKLIDGSIPTKNKKKNEKMRLQHRCFPVNFVKCLRIHFLRTSPVTASEDEHDKTKLLDMNPDSKIVIFESHAPSIN